MKTLRQVCAAFVLTLVLSLPAFAGEISTPFAPPPPSQQATAQGEIQTTITGDISTGLTGDISTTFAPVLNIMLSVLPLI